MSSKSPEIELSQLKEAISYLAGVVEDGSLLSGTGQKQIRQFSEVLRLLVAKVEGLPDEVPVNLVHAAAVRAIVGAYEEQEKLGLTDKERSLAHNKHQVEIAAEVQGHRLGEWTLISDTGEDEEYQAICQACGGLVHASAEIFYTLTFEECTPRTKESIGQELSGDAIVALWDMTQEP